MPAVLQVQAQRGRRRFRQRAFGAVEERQPGIFLRSQLQAAHPGEPDTFRPGQDGSTTTVAQSLFAGPQGFFFTAGTHKEQTLERQTTRLQRGRVGDPRRINQHHPLSLFADCRQDGQQQAELTESGLRGNQFGHGTQRPPFPRQAAIQPRISGGQRVLPVIGAMPFPEFRRGIEQFVQGTLLHKSSCKSEPCPRFCCCSVVPQSAPTQVLLAKGNALAASS